MANLYIKNGGAWAPIKSGSSVKNGGAWASLKGVWVRDAGTWKQAFSPLTISLDNWSPSLTGVSSASYPSRITLRFTETGTVEAYREDVGYNTYSTLTTANWVNPTSEAVNYEFKATVLSGSLSHGSTGTWLPPSTPSWVPGSAAANWTVTNSTPGTTSTAVLLVEVRRAGTTTVLDSATYTISATKP